MKCCKAVMGLIVTGLVLSADLSKAQLNFGPDSSVLASLTGQELTGVSPGGNNGINAGSISSWVVSDAAVDSSGLIFVYQIVNSDPNPITGIVFSGIVSSQILSEDVYTSVTGINGGGPGDGYRPGNYLVICTDSHDFDLDYCQDHYTFPCAGNIYAPCTAPPCPTPAPTPTPVPEANTVIAGALMLLPLGIGTVRAVRKRRTL